MSIYGVAALKLFLETWARRAVAGRFKNEEEEDAAFRDALKAIEDDFKAFLLESRRTS